MQVLISNYWLWFGKFSCAKHFFLLYTEASERVRELGYKSVLAQYTPHLSFAFPSLSYRFRHAASWVCKSDRTYNNALFFKTNVSGAGPTAFLQCHSEIPQGLKSLTKRCTFLFRNSYSGKLMIEVLRSKTTNFV